MPFFSTGIQELSYNIHIRKIKLQYKSGFIWCYSKVIGRGNYLMRVRLGVELGSFVWEEQM